MKRVLRIAIKEFKDYFVSPIAYIVISIFLLVTGWFFFATFFLFNQASMGGFFSLLPTIFSLVIPAVTMKLFSEEFNVGSYETLATLPVTSGEIVLGKYFAGAAFIAIMLVPTVSYPLFISSMGHLDPGPVAGGYLGALLLGGAYASVGLLASSLTGNQIIAFIVGLIICFSLTVIDKMLVFFPGQILSVIGYLGADYHFRNIARGIIDTRDIVYFVSLIFISLYGTWLAIDEK